MKNLKNALEFFRDVDPVLYGAGRGLKVLESAEYSPDKYFFRLTRAIAGQQLSVKAAATIYGRFEELVDGEILPENVLRLEHEDLRGVGLSNAKANYILSLAQSVIDKDIDFDGLDNLDSEAAIEQLVKLKGIGRWSAEMFLMFTLGREDLFSTGDLGLKRAIERLYGVKDPDAKYLLKLSDKWSPYRTYACRILWDSLDNEPDV